MIRPWEPFRGSEIRLKLTEGPKSRPEVFCGALRSSAMQSNIIFGWSTLTAELALLELLTDNFKAPQKASDLYSPSPSQHSIVVYCVNKLHKFSLYNVYCHISTYYVNRDHVFLWSITQISHDISHPIGSMQIPLEHTQTMKELPDPSYHMLVMQYIWRCGKGGLRLQNYSYS